MNDTNIPHDNVKISVCLAIRNGGKYMKYVDRLFKEIESKYVNYSFEFFIYENNSNDDTKSCIEQFAKDRNCKYLMEDIPNNTMHSGINSERGNHMATIRNRLKEFHGYLESDYTLLFDCDVVFLPNTIKRLIQSFDDRTAMVSSFCICWDYYTKNNKAVHYYDSLAFISDDNISYEENDNKCLFKSCHRCTNYRNYVNKPIPDSSLLDTINLIKVKSAFGSLSLIKTDIYNNVQWGNSICEHHSFCEQVNYAGNIMVNPTIEIFTSLPSFTDYDSIEKELIARGGIRIKYM